MFSIFHALLPFHLFIVGLVGEGEGEDALTDEVAPNTALSFREPVYWKPTFREHTPSRYLGE